MCDDFPITKEHRQYVKEVTALSEVEIQKVERVCNALRCQFLAEADKEAHQKIRILFERAAKEWLPFIVYCLTFASVGGVAIYKIVSLDGWKLIVSWIGLILLMLIPVLFAPWLHRHKSEDDKIDSK